MLGHQRSKTNNANEVKQTQTWQRSNQTECPMSGAVQNSAKSWRQQGGIRAAAAQNSKSARCGHTLRKTPWSLYIKGRPQRDLESKRQAKMNDQRNLQWQRPNSRIHISRSGTIYQQITLCDLSIAECAFELPLIYP